MLWSILRAALFVLVATGAAAQAPNQFDNNADSIAVIIGNRDYKQTVPVDFAHNDADAIREYLLKSLGFREQNIFVLKNATLNELNQVFGTERNPQSGRLWRSVAEGRSNVFVYYSGHGVPDLATRQPFLLPQDGNPNQSESGYLLDTLYRNLDLVKQKIGGSRHVIVMIDACFTGETGRKGETLLAVSAPGFEPARPKAANHIVKLVATSGASPANWDETSKLGLFTSRFLMGVAGLARKSAPGGGDGGALQWSELQTYLKDEVALAARRDTGREQIPEIDAAPISLKINAPVSAIMRPVAIARDEANWRDAQTAGTREALERYVGQCRDICSYRPRAMSLLLQRKEDAETVRDEQNWQRLSALGKYQDYLDGCGAVCSYRTLAESYLGKIDPDRDPKVKRCDELAAGPDDPDKPAKVKGRPMQRLNGDEAIEACLAASRAHPSLRRLSYQLGRGYDKADRYRQAAEAYKRAMDAGSVSAMNNLAGLYENGQGVKLSHEQALSLYRRSAEAGNVIAMSNVARMLQYGRGAPKNEAEALRWYQKAAEAGDSYSITKLVPYYMQGGPGIPRDPRKAFDLFKFAADKGDPLAIVSMATLIDNGLGAHFPGVSSADLIMRALKQGEPGSAAVAATDGKNLKLKPETIRAVQYALQKGQYYNGAADGRLNPMFVRSLDLYAKSSAQDQE
jgi:TPR repeat protein